MQGPGAAARMHVVIVNYRTGDLVVDCLASLEAEVAAMPSLRVTVVDNASPDRSGATIARAIADRRWGRWATLVSAPRNGGFAAGNNVAIRPLLDAADAPDLFWLLNPDTRVVPGAAAAIARFMRDRPDVGIVGTALVEGNGELWPYAFRFPTILSEIERGVRLGPVSRLLAKSTVLRRMDACEEVDWVPGASMVVRREVFTTAGLMDDGYFLYYEETDFCLAARRAGWPTWYLPDASVVHIAGASTGLTGSQPAEGRVPRYWFDSRRRYFTRNHGRGYAILADLAWAAAHIVWRVRRRLTAKPDPDPPSLLGDFFRNSALMVGPSPDR